jgi:hypothetical protein
MFSDGHMRPVRARRLAARSGLVIVCVATLTACGSGGFSVGTTAAGALKVADCLRSHGVPNFPDPGGPSAAGIKQSPAFRSAIHTCLRLDPPATATGKTFTGAQRIAALAQVTCIRNHGMPNFPDPTFPRSGGELFPAIPGFNPESPAFRQAATACALSGPVGQPRGG